MSILLVQEWTMCGLTYRKWSQLYDLVKWSPLWVGFQLYFARNCLVLVPTWREGGSLLVLKQVRVYELCQLINCRAVPNLMSGSKLLHNGLCVLYLLFSRSVWRFMIYNVIYLINVYLSWMLYLYCITFHIILTLFFFHTVYYIRPLNWCLMNQKLSKCRLPCHLLFGSSNKMA